MDYIHIPTEFQIPNFGDLMLPNMYSNFDFDYKQFLADLCAILRAQLYLYILNHNNYNMSI
jgi:hypothetical protein